MNNHFDMDHLRKYVQGELSPAEMYALEKASHQDEMLMDLILGLEQEKQLRVPFDQKELDSAIYERTHPKKSIKKISYYWFSAAAAILIACGLGLFWYKNNQVQETKVTQEIALAPSSQEIPDSTINIAPIDSIDIELPVADQQLALVAPQKVKKKIEEQVLADVQKPSLRLPAAPAGDLIQEGPFKKKQSTSTANESQILANKLDTRIAGIQVEKNTVVIRGSTIQNKSTIVGAVPRVGSAQDGKTIATGRVLDQNSGRPLAHVTVRDLKTNEIAITDSAGQYIMPLSSENQQLELNSLGYETKRIIASNNKIIQLQPSQDALEEVVVVGYGGRAAKTKSEPIVGWAAFKKYLNDQTSLSLTGKGAVTLVFDISHTNGRPITIIVKKSTNPDLNQKAIQIIQNGPDWQLGNDGKKVELKVEFD